MQDLLKRVILTGLDAQAKVVDFLDELVKKGKMDEKEREEFVKEMDAKLDRSKEWMEDLSNDITRRISEKSPFICKKEFDALKEQLDLLAKRLASLETAAKKEHQGGKTAA